MSIHHNSQVKPPAHTVASGAKPAPLIVTTIPPNSGESGGRTLLISGTLRAGSTDGAGNKENGKEIKVVAGSGQKRKKTEWVALTP